MRQIGSGVGTPMAKSRVWAHAALCGARRLPLHENFEKVFGGSGVRVEVVFVPLRATHADMSQIHTHAYIDHIIIHAYT